MAPFQRRMLWQRRSPARRLRKLRRLVRGLEHLVEDLPARILDLVDQGSARQVRRSS